MADRACMEQYNADGVFQDSYNNTHVLVHSPLAHKNFEPAHCNQGRKNFAEMTRNYGAWSIQVPLYL